MDFAHIPFYISGFVFMFLTVLLMLSGANAGLVIASFAVGITLFGLGASIAGQTEARRDAYDREMRQYNLWLLLGGVLNNLDKKLDKILEQLAKKKRRRKKEP